MKGEKMYSICFLDPELNYNKYGMRHEICEQFFHIPLIAERGNYIHGLCYYTDGYGVLSVKEYFQRYGKDNIKTSGRVFTEVIRRLSRWNSRQNTTKENYYLFLKINEIPFDESLFY